jgi:putative ABC transport system permease protein
MGSHGLAQAFDGNLAVMDIYAAQHVFGRGRRFDRIDIRAKAGVSVDRCQAALRRALGAGFGVDPPSARGKHFEALLHSYSTTISISSLFALIVGVFIIFNSFAIAMVHRRAEIGILRALGATRRQIQKLFLFESLLAGLIGSVVGVAVGLVGALAVARYVSAITEQAGGVDQRVTALDVNPLLVALAVVLGAGVSVLGAWLPARGAARTDPVKALQKGAYQTLSLGESRRRRTAALVLAVASCGCIALSESSPLFYAGYVFMMLAGLLLAPTLTRLLSKAGRPILKEVLPVEGALAADSLVQTPRRTSATVSALMLSVAMVIGFRGVAQSYYAAFEQWLDDTMNPDFFIAPSTNLTKLGKTFPGDLARVIERVEGVRDVQLVRNARVIIREIPAMVMVLQTTRAAITTRPVVRQGSLEEMNRLTAGGKGTIVSESFAIIRKMRMGDLVEVPTPSGPLTLPIVGIVQDYMDMQGSLFIDRGVYLKFWRDDTANSARVYVNEGENPGAVRQRIVSALAGHAQLFVLTNREVREWILGILEQWFAMTYGQIAIAILVAVLGIVNTLTVSILDRRRDLGIMRAVGGFRYQVRRTVWVEAIAIGVIGVILGIALGAANLYYTLGMVKRDLAGVDLQYVFPFWFAVLLVPTILAAALAAALGPGGYATRRALVEALEYE